MVFERVSPGKARLQSEYCMMPFPAELMKQASLVYAPCISVSLMPQRQRKANQPRPGNNCRRQQISCSLKQANVFPVFRAIEQEMPGQLRRFWGFVSFDFDSDSDFDFGFDCDFGLILILISLWVFICYVTLPACNGCVVSKV